VTPDFTLPKGFLTLADLGEAWIEGHCVQPDRALRGKPLKLTDWQFYVLAHRYQIRPNARFVPPEEVTLENQPVFNQAFVYRSTLIIGPQKLGKGPLTSAFAAFEGSGPSVFAGFAKGHEKYICRDNGCECDFEYSYWPGEPMGMRHPSPLIQLGAFSESQVQNIYRPLKTMTQMGALKFTMTPREGFIRILSTDGSEGLDRIDTVTSSANSRLGNPISDAELDELGLWLRSNKMDRFFDNASRGAAGMGGRIHGWTNCWDITQNSVAQQIYEAKQKDVWVFYLNPDVLRDENGEPLDYSIKAHRRLIHEFVYFGSPWVDLDSIEAEAASLVARGNQAQAERYFGNRLVAGKGTFVPPTLWTDRTVDDEPTNLIALGFDGSANDDWTAIRAEDSSGLRFTPTFTIAGEEYPTIWDPDKHGGEIPRHEVRAAVDQIFKKYHVAAFFCDDREFETQIDQWARQYGEKRVVKFPTYNPTRMHYELERYITDLAQCETEHLYCPITEVHAMNAVTKSTGNDKYILAKPPGQYERKIDAFMADILSHAAAAYAHKNGLFETATKKKYYYLPD